MKNLTRFLKTKHQRRKGVGAEMALATLMILFALCSLILSFSMIQVNNLDEADDRMKDRNTLDQIGESFCAATASGSLWTLDNQEYSASVTTEGNFTTLTVTNRKDAVVLTVKLEQTGTACVVTQWSYQ